MSPQQKFRMLVLAVCFIWSPAITSAASVTIAIFPLQEFGEGRNDANLPFTRELAEHLTNSGNEIIGLDTVIAFMANNRIRTVGHLETFIVSRVRGDLGAAFILLGTVSQRKEKPEPTVGLTLNLIRTSDARTIWTYIGSLSTSEKRRILGIGEPQSTLELQSLLLEELTKQWPWQVIYEEQQARSINLDSTILEPKYVRPGDEVHSRVRLSNTWPAGQAPRVFFKAGDQLYPATVLADGSTYETTWVAGEENGRFPVILHFEWPHYGRTETVLLGNYLIDGTPPLFEIELRGTKIIDDIPVFNSGLVIIPRMLIHKPLSHWRLMFYNEDGSLAAEMDGPGNLPERFTWFGVDKTGRLEDGIFNVVLEAWDRSGNSAKAAKRVEMNRSLPIVDLAVGRSDEGIVVDLDHKGKVPLAFWRLEMWDKEGKILTKTEGEELPVKIEIELPHTAQEQEIRGFLFYQDVLGKKIRKNVEDLLPKLRKEAKAEEKKKKPTGISESWVEEF